MVLPRLLWDFARWSPPMGTYSVCGMLPFLRLAPVPDSEPNGAMSGPISIVLADDHAVMRESLRTLLDAEADLVVIAETDSLKSVVGHVRTHRPDVLVLDLGMPDHGSGIETLTRLSRDARDTNIVVITMNDDPSFARRALGNGAIGLVLKELADSDLPEAVRNASRGRR